MTQGKSERYEKDTENGQNNDFDPRNVPTDVDQSQDPPVSTDLDLDISIPRQKDESDSPLPFIYNREGTSAGRDLLSVYCLTETERQIDRFQTQVAQQFPNEDVQALDVREALLLAGMQNADGAINILESWGYGLKSD